MNLHRYWSAEKYDVNWTAFFAIILLIIVLSVAVPYHSLLGSSVQLLMFFPVVNGMASRLVESKNKAVSPLIKTTLTIFIILFACTGVMQAESRYLADNGEWLYLFPIVPIASFLIGLLIFTPEKPLEPAALT